MDRRRHPLLEAEVLPLAELLPLVALVDVLLPPDPPAPPMPPAPPVPPAPPWPPVPPEDDEGVLSGQSGTSSHCGVTSSLSGEQAAIVATATSITKDPR
jgi:hypothetical protein